MSTAEAAEYLGLSVWTVRELAKQGQLRYYRAGVTAAANLPLRFRVADLDAWMAERVKLDSLL